MSPQTSPEQYELFHQFPAGRDQPAKRRTARPVFYLDRLQVSVPYEQVVLAVIGLVLWSVLVYAFGVERGQQRAAVAPEQPVMHARAPEPPPARAPEPAPPTEPEDTPLANTTERASVPAPLAPAGRFTIQLVAYTHRSRAEREAGLLRSAGYSPSVRESGAYTLLSVGDYATRSEAQRDLARLRTTYRDCFVRSH